MARQPTAHRVCRVEDLPPGGRKIVDVAGRSIGVFNIAGELHAIRNSCPHQQAPLCEGTVSGTTLPGTVGEFRYGCEGRIIRCPWHGWEFDLTTGQSVFNPHRCRVRSYDVRVEPSDHASGGSREAEREQSDTGESRDPGVETFEVEVRERWVMLLV